jgi:metallo-beta-lactamase family protein
MMEGARTVRVHGMDVPVRAQFVCVSGLSAHADRSELLRWVKTQPRRPERVFITHAEEKASAAFGQLLRSELSLRTIEPKLGDRFELEASS